MTAYTETNHIGFDRVSQSKNQIGLIHQDLERIEDIHQIRICLVSLTRKMTASDSTRKMALIEVVHALSNLETAQNIIRSAQAN